MSDLGDSKFYFIFKKEKCAIIFKHAINYIDEILSSIPHKYIDVSADNYPYLRIEFDDGEFEKAYVAFRIAATTNPNFIFK